MVQVTEDSGDSFNIVLNKGSRKDSVRVLGEVTVAGCVEKVDDTISVRELEHGRSD